MDTQDHAIYHVWIRFIPTSLYPRRRKSIWSELELNPGPLASEATALTTRPWLLGQVWEWYFAHDWPSPALNVVSRCLHWFESRQDGDIRLVEGGDRLFVADLDLADEESSIRIHRNGFLVLTDEDENPAILLNGFSESRPWSVADELDIDLILDGSLQGWLYLRLNGLLVWPDRKSSKMA